MEHKKYKKIDSFRSKYESAFKKGDRIVIQEKLDGSNASILYDGREIHAFSRRLSLTPTNNLNGFWQYAQTVKKVDVLKGLRIYGEWLVKHSIHYSEDAYLKFYLFDVYNDETDEYYPQEKVKEVSELLDIPMVHTFYEGEFQGWEHALSFVGKSSLGEEGEGVVVKNLDNLNNPDSKVPFYIKLVAPEFQERRNTKERTSVDLAVLAERAYEINLVESIVNEARVRKKLFTLVEVDLIPRDYGLEDMGTIVRHLGKLIYTDCVEEEPEIVEAVGPQFGKYAASIAIDIARKIAATN